MMSRPEADDLIAEFEAAMLELRRYRGMSNERTVWARMNAIRERIIDVMSGEEGTTPLAGNAR